MESSRQLPAHPGTAGTWWAAECTGPTPRCDTVIGSDRGKIGTVQEVHAADGSGVPYMTVSGGILTLGGKLHIPLETVVQRAGTDIFINIPELVATKMPWHEPPTRETQQDKEGVPLDSVAMLYGSVQPTGDTTAGASAAS